MNLKYILLSFVAAFSMNVSAQTFDPFYAGVANNCNLDSITSYLQKFESFGVKEYGTTELMNARDWLLSKYASYGYTDVVQDEFVVLGNTLTNIVVTKTGTLYPDQFVIIDGHYDTKNGTGTNDNGTGTAIILEIARLLKDIPTEYSIKFIHFSAEEIGLVGSTNYVDNTVVPENMNIKIVFNIDEVGGINGMVNDKIVCERDESPPAGNNAQSAIMTDELATCVQLYSSLTPEISFAYASDYVPFMNNGYVVTGFYEKNETPYAHTANDSIAYVDIPYVHQISKAATGAMLHWAIAYDDSSVDEIENSSILLYPNPTREDITLCSMRLRDSSASISIVSLTGEVVYTSHREQLLPEEHFNLNYLNKGCYIFMIQAGNTTLRRQIIIQ